MLDKKKLAIMLRDDELARECLKHKIKEKFSLNEEEIEIKFDQFIFNELIKDKIPHYREKIKKPREYRSCRNCKFFRHLSYSEIDGWDMVAYEGACNLEPTPVYKKQVFPCSRYVYRLA